MFGTVRGIKLAGVTLIFGCCSLRADFIPISQPTATYMKGTTLLDFTDPDHTQVGALFGGVETLYYDNLLEELTVPNSWAVWGSPPATETSTPRIGYTDTASELTITLGAAATTFGFELEPDNTSPPEQMTAAFYSGTTLVGTISRTPSGNAGALLYAASTTTNPFTSVVINNLADPSDDFAIARQRFTLINPEPSTFGLAALAAGAVLFAWVRRARQHQCAAR